MSSILMSASPEIDFFIHAVFKYQLFGQDLYITTTHVCVLIVMLGMVIFAFAGRNAVLKGGEVPSGFQNVAELVVELLDGVCGSTMGKWSPRFRNYISTIFIFILLSNFSGLIGLRPPTADYGVTLPMGLITFSTILYNKLKYQKLSGFIAGLCDPWPIWAPINVIGDCAVPISLSLRLFANVLSGVVMEALVYTLLKSIAYVWPAALHVYFDLFSGAIQTYVFCMLSMTYFASACETE